jgi:predicted aminopeptidase
VKAAALALMVSFLSSCATQLGYLAKQGNYLLRYSSGTESIDDLLASPATPPDTRQFLQRVKEIRRFAVQRIGLRDNGNYTRYKAIHRDYLVDVVQACRPLSFTPYQWSYPFMGRLPYKGFYERPDALAEADRLKKEGYDVIVRKVDAFSTLGFTKDPVYSFMAKYSPYQLASTIIHEQTHATLWVKGQTDFNEELANFVGDTGALEWITDHFGPTSTEYQAAMDEKTDSETFVEQLKTLAKALSEVYDSPIPPTYKRERKEQLIGAFKTRLARQAGSLFHSPEFKKIGDLPINNAYISLYNLYTADVPLLHAWYAQRCGSSLRAFMLSMEKLAKNGDVKEQLRQGLSESVTQPDAAAPDVFDAASH